jgi:hypothetical protein
MSRSPSQVLFAVDALQVETPGIYWPSWLKRADGSFFPVTHCNGYAQAVLAVLGKKIPTIKANDLVEWFGSNAAKLDGWNPCESVGSLAPIEVARQRAELGFPTVAVWHSRDEKEDGHIAVLVPAPDELVGTTMVSAAGAACFKRTRIENSFGRDKLAQLLFYTAD